MANPTQTAVERMSAEERVFVALMMQEGMLEAIARILKPIVDRRASEIAAAMQPHAVDAVDAYDFAANLIVEVGGESTGHNRDWVANRVTQWAATRAPSNALRDKLLNIIAFNGENWRELEPKHWYGMLLDIDAALAAPKVGGK